MLFIPLCICTWTVTITSCDQLLLLLFIVIFVCIPIRIPVWYYFIFSFGVYNAKLSVVHHLDLSELNLDMSALMWHPDWNTGATKNMWCFEIVNHLNESQWLQMIVFEMTKNVFLLQCNFEAVVTMEPFMCWWPVLWEEIFDHSIHIFSSFLLVANWMVNGLKKHLF